MASNGEELLGELYERDHLTFEELERLDLSVVTEDGETVPTEELRGKIFRLVDRDEPSGYVVRNMETTGEAATLCYLRLLVHAKNVRHPNRTVVGEATRAVQRPVRTTVVGRTGRWESARRPVQLAW